MYLDPIRNLLLNRACKLKANSIENPSRVDSLKWPNDDGLMASFLLAELKNRAAGNNGIFELLNAFQCTFFLPLRFRSTLVFVQRFVPTALHRDD